MFARIACCRQTFPLLAICCISVSCLAGCTGVAQHRINNSTTACLPKETAMTSPLVEYDVGLGDVLTVEVARLIPKSPYRLQSADEISIMAYGLEDVDEDLKINGSYRLQPGGTIMLPPPIGSVSLAGMTCEEVGALLTERICEELDVPEKYRELVGVSVEMLTFSGLQPVAGYHVVGADGRIILGIYGSVHVAGLSLANVKEALEFHLAEYLEDPKVAVDIYAYNSKSYYVILEGAGFGDKPQSFPYTGNDTVLDAIAAVNGMERVSSKRIWIARPSSIPYGQSQILLVDWQGITAQACHQTNYQLMPNDRIFIEEDKFVAFDTRLSKVIAPLERIMGFTLLGAQTATRFSGNVLQGGGDPSGGGR